MNGIWTVPVSVDVLNFKRLFNALDLQKIASFHGNKALLEVAFIFVWFCGCCWFLFVDCDCTEF